MNLSVSVEKFWVGLSLIAFPVWVTGLAILLGRPAWLYNLLALQPIRDQWRPWIGVLTVFFFALWVYERVWPQWHNRFYRLWRWARSSGRDIEGFR